MNSTTDYFQIDELLTDEHKMIRQTVRDYVDKEIIPIIDEHAHKHIPIPNLMKNLGSIGALGPYIPEEYGGAGMDQIAYGLIMQELERGDSAVRSAASVQSSLVMFPIYSYASEEQKRKYLPKLATGEMIGCFGLTEPDAGSNPGGMLTTAEKVAGGYKLNGNKMWITNGPDAQTYVVYAKTDMAAGPKGMTAFIVERGTKGFSQAQKLDKLGMRSSNTCELVFQDCEVPAENILGEEGAGVKVLMSGLDYERVVLSGGPLGIMQACMDLVVPYIHDRKQFGQSIGEFQLVQGKLADMYTQMNAARAYVYAVARSCDRGETTRKDSAGAILYAAELATKMSLDAIQLLGGNGYINEFAAGRLLRDAKLYEIGAGTSEIRRMLIGRELFKESV